MSARQAKEVAAQFNERLQSAVACVTDSVLIPRRDQSGPAYHLLLEPEARLSSAGGTVEVRIVHSYNVVPDPDTTYRVSTASYFYDVTELRQYGERDKVLGYHWNPNSSRDDPAFPHVHVHSNREIGGKSLGKIHLPTGKVSLEAFIRLLIIELGVASCRTDWESALEQTEATFLTRRRP